MRCRPIVSMLSLLVLFGIPLSDASASPSGYPGPPLRVAEETLADALSCPESLSGSREPVLLVHGTAGTAEAWSWNYVKVLSSEGYDVCTVTLPDYGRADIQVSSEYVVHAIRSMASRSGKKVDVIGFSQGPLEPRWAIKWWPDIRRAVDDMVAMAGVSHGASALDVACARSCIAPFWQMKPTSKFLAALNAGDESPGDVSYTSVFSRTDEYVWVTGESPWDDSTRIEGAANVAIQDLCPGRGGEHFQALFDAVYYAVIVDALANPGPADPRRVDRAVCLQGAMPGVDRAQAEITAVQYHQDFYVKVGDHHTEAEPALAAYAQP